MLGIGSYNPHFYSNTKDLVADLSNGLKQLIGKRILEVWTVYDEKNKEWFKDCPVVLNIEGIQLEVCVNKLDELAITFDMIDMAEEINWYDINDFDLKWKEGIFPELALVKNKKISNIEIVEFNFRTEINDSTDKPQIVENKISAWILNGIGFILETGYFSVYNGLDENEISLKPDLSRNIRTLRIG